MSSDHIGQMFRKAIELDAPERAELLAALPDDERQQLVMLLDADSMGDESGLFVSLRDDGKEELPPEPSSLTNKRIRDYDLLEIIGEGGMGTVYRAHHSKLKCDVALKVLPLHRVGRADTIERFEREMAAVGQLRHPNIVQAMDAGEERGLHYLVLEFVDGSNVATVSKSVGKLKVADACEVIRQTAQGLAHAHERGLIHRDIKPSNLLVSKQGDVRIADLGLATLQTAASGLTSAGQIMGTVDYIAPEQIEDPRHVDPRADLYSLGCTFYQLLTGRAPFDEPDLGSVLRKLRAHESATPEPVTSIRDDVPPAVVKLVNRLIAKKPDDRVQSASEVAQVLATFCESADLNTLVRRADRTSTIPGAIPTERMQGGNTDAATNPPPVQANLDPANTARQSALKKPLIGLGCLAAVAALAFLAGRLGGDADSEPEQGQEVVASSEPEIPPVVATEPPSASEPAAATPPPVDTTPAPTAGADATAEYEEAVKRAFQNGVVQVNFQDRNVWTRSSNADEFLKCNQPTSDGKLPPALVEIDPAVATAPMALVELKRMCRIHTVKIKGQAPLSDAMIRSIDVPGLAELVSYALITNRQLTKLPVASELTALRMRGPVEINAHEQRVDAVLEHFPNLQELEINAKGMSLDTFNLLQPLNLNRLSLFEPSKEALAALAEFKSIKMLDIRTDSKEETQDWFGALPGELEGLYIHGFFLTVGEKELKAMRRYRLLRVLQLNCDYSADGLEAFRAANPNCIVHLRRQP